MRHRPVTSPCAKVVYAKRHFPRPERSPGRDTNTQPEHPRRDWSCTWDIRSKVRQILRCQWVQNTISWFKNVRKRVCGQTQSHKLDRQKRRRLSVNLHVTVPGDNATDWTFPSQHTAQKQRIFAGIHPFDMNVTVLPYSTRMDHDKTPPWKSIKTPCTRRNA
jgi:hypothetical protein